MPVHARVLDFHSDIRIAKSGELTVTERITVEAREKDDLLQRELPAGAQVIEVIRDGHPEAYALDGTRLRIGAAPLPQGRHLLQIAYRSAQRIRFLDGHDELSWKIAGLAAERVTAEVTLPAGVPAKDIRVQTDQQSFVREGRAAFRSLRPLAPGEAMSFTVRFPKNVVAAPRIEWGGALAVLVLLGLAAGVLWRLKTLSARR